EPFAPEPGRHNWRQVPLSAENRQFRGRMPLDCEREFCRRHAVAIILDHDEIGTAVRGSNVDAPGARIERVLDEFLHRARRPLHHLACGDAVDRPLGEAADRHQPPLSSSKYLRASTLPSSTAGWSN